MANDPQNPMNDDGLPPDDDAAQGESRPASMPRRAASAEFVVSSAIGSEAALREAMDPANQSLAEALRLSYRVLQIVLVVLIVLFLISGVRTVEPAQTGVKLQFGAIQKTADGGEALSPGVKFAWPFPAGEFVLIDAQNRGVDLRNSFWPYIPPGRTIEQAIEAANPGVALKPGQDGYVIVAGSDVAHLKIIAQYEILDPGQFLRCIEDRQADTLVQWALRRATIHVTAKLTLEGVSSLTAESRSDIRDEAQAVLDAVGSGIRITELNIPDTRPPLAVVKAQRELGETIVRRDKLLEQARQSASRQLTELAGPNYEKIIDLIEQYELTLGSDESAEAEAIYQQLGELIAGEEAAGDVAQTIERARAYLAEVESTLGSEARLFGSLIEAYRQSPRLVVQRRWLDAYQSVMQAGDVEVMYAPAGVGAFILRLASNQRIAQLRMDMQLRRLEQRTMDEAMGFTRSITAQEITTDGAGHRLKFDEHGNPISPRDQ